MTPQRDTGDDMRSARGFTLTELVIVMAIVAVLAAIAIPSYQQHVLRTNRAAAQQFLMHVANRQEQFFLDNRGYAGGLAALNVAVPDEVNDFYTVTVATVAGPPPGFTLTAAPRAGTAQATDGDLTLAADGNRTGKW